MATAVHSVRSHESASSSAASSNKSEKTSDDFDKKLASAKKKHASAAKPVVVDLSKKQAAKSLSSEADQSATDEDAEKSEGGTDQTAEKNSLVTAGKTGTANKAKTSAHTDADAAADATQTAKTQNKAAVAPVDPDAGKHQGQKRPDAKTKSSANGTGSLNAANLNQTTQPQAANDNTDDESDGEDGDSQQSVGQLTSQPTFGVATGNGLPASSRPAADENTAAASDDSDGGNSDAASSAAAAENTGTFASAIADAVATVGHATPSAGHTDSVTPTNEPGTANLQTPSTPLSTPAAKAAASVATTAQARFVEDNHPKIVTGISGQLMPKGGTMQLRLDPAGLGAVEVTVRMREGTMSAEFATSSDEATRMLSHSLGQLKSTLESAGLSVEKLHVEQAPKREGQSNNSDSESNSATHEQQQQAQQEKQRREMMQRMWAKLAGGDPLDMVA